MQISMDGCDCLWGGGGGGGGFIWFFKLNPRSWVPRFGIFMTNWAPHSIHSKCACRHFEPAFPIQPDWMLCRIAVLGQSLGRHVCIPVQPIASFCVLCVFPPKVLLSMVLTKVVQQSCRETGCSCFGSATLVFHNFFNS